MRQINSSSVRWSMEIKKESNVPPPPLFDNRKLQAFRKEIINAEASNGLTNNSAFSSYNMADMQSRRVWDVAFSPFKQIPMNMFMMWMSGNSLSLFPLMMIVMMLTKPFQAIFTCNSTFDNELSTFDTSDNDPTAAKHSTLLPKLIFILGNITLTAMVLFKCHMMGILPLYASDWVSYKGRHQEKSNIALRISSNSQWI
ncbi:hypothetical protein GJ496_006619 [Pomphorhynchus laevis]|nr:hypothetical protein GJ496_006619 [Pomphorhynchus laevis]